MYTVVMQPNTIIQQILKFANDIESNPGPEYPGPGYRDHLNIIFSNINSLTADEGRRFEDLKLRLFTENVHIAAISETGTNLNLDDFNIDHYHKLDSNYHRPHGLGMIIYVHDTLIAKRRHDLEEVNIEGICGLRL